MKFKVQGLPFEIYQEIGCYLSVKDFCNFRRSFCISHLIYSGKYCTNISKEILYILRFCKVDKQSEMHLISVLKHLNFEKIPDLEKITLYVIRSNYTSALGLIINSNVKLTEFESFKKIFKYVNTLETAKVLIEEAKIDVNECQALLYSCRPEISQYLIVEQQAFVNMGDSKRYTPLHFAPNLEIAKILVKYGADTCALSIYNSTPLHYARSPEIAKFFLDNGGHVNFRDNFGATPLHLAKNHQVAQVLINYGANVRSRDLSGRTPLHQTRSVELAKLLIDNGADVNARDDHGQSPLFDFNLQAPISPELTQLLLDSGAFVNLADRYGRTSLNVSKTEENSKVLAARGGFNSTDFLNMDRIVYDQRR